MNKFVPQTDIALKKKKKRWTTKGRQVENKYLELAANATSCQI